MSWIPADVFRQKGEEQRPRSQRAGLPGNVQGGFSFTSCHSGTEQDAILSVSGHCQTGWVFIGQARELHAGTGAAAETDRHFCIRCSFCSEPFSSSPVPVIPSTGNLSMYRSPPTVDRLRISRLTCAISSRTTTRSSTSPDSLTYASWWME